MRWFCVRAGKRSYYILQETPPDTAFLVLCIFSVIFMVGQSSLQQLFPSKHFWKLNANYALYVYALLLNHFTYSPNTRVIPAV